MNPASEKSSYIGALDFWKFLFSIIIVFYHGGLSFHTDTYQIFSNGALAVDFFFLVSGYLMAVSVSKMEDRELSIGKDTLSFLWRKIRAFLPYYLVAFFFAFISWGIFSFDLSSSFLKNATAAIGCLQNFLLLDMTGIHTTSVMGLTWYLSAMLLAMAIIYPLFRKYRETYLYLIAPFSCLLLAGYMCQTYGALTPYNEFGVLVFHGMARAVLELNLGCFVFLVSRLLSQINLTKLSRVLLTIFEWGFYFVVIAYLYTGKRSDVFTVLFLLFFALTISTSHQSAVSFLFDNRVCKFLGKFSLVLYLSQTATRRMIASLLPDQPWYIPFCIYVIATILLALLSMGIVSFTRHFWKKYGTHLSGLLISHK